MVLFFTSIVMLTIGHIFKVMRWHQSVKIYEKTNKSVLFRALVYGYMVNFIFPFRIGDIVRSFVAGRKMKNGVSFSIATVIIDRYLDVIVVGLIFFIFYLLGYRDKIVFVSSIFYIILTLLLIILSIIAVKYSKYPKLIMRKVSSIFNERINLTILYFTWAIISAFKDIYQKINKKRLCLYTFVMWGSYLISYYLLANFLSTMGNDMRLINIFTLLFSKTNLDAATIDITKNLNGLVLEFPLIISIYMLSPLFALFLYSLLPSFKNGYLAITTNDIKYLNILPQVNAKDKLQFLDTYFSGTGKQYLNNYLELNRDINIVEDFSAGSNATTMLCMDEKQTFYRKYAFGNDAEKLSEQIKWLHRYETLLPVTSILREENKNKCCYYDMVYNNSAIGLFNYIHSEPIEKSWGIIESVLKDLKETLYTINVRSASIEKISNYINLKALANIKKIKNSKEIKPLLEYDYLIINGVKYKNFNYFSEYLSFENLYENFKNDIYSDIHGDLTIENIICFQNEKINKKYYLIDPNTGNIHDSPNLDYGKLLQSLHGGYEFLMKTNNIEIHKNEINFLFTKSYAYYNVYNCYKKYLFDNFSIEQVKSIFFHEIVHWLRLLPYKIEKNGKRAVLFYAGLIIVLNEIILDFEEKNNNEK